MARDQDTGIGPLLTREEALELLGDDPVKLAEWLEQVLGETARAELLRPAHVADARSKPRRSLAASRKKSVQRRARRAATENAVLTADLLGAVADAIIDLHEEIRSTQAAVSALGSMRPATDRPQADDVIPLQILVQALQGIQSQLTDDRERSERIDARVAHFGSALAALDAQVRAERATDAAGNKLDRIEGTLRTLAENASRVHAGEGEVAAAVVRLTEDAGRLRAEIAAARASSDAAASAAAALTARQDAERSGDGGPQRAAVVSPQALPWFVIAVAVLALTWAAALFLKTGHATIPLIGMAAANAACCLALLVWPPRR
jgi:hypothetical protein